LTSIVAEAQRFRAPVLFDIKELGSLPQRNEGLLKKLMNQGVRLGIDEF
jgi:hypothetical protein